MLHIKSQDHRSIASGEDLLRIFKVFSIDGHGGHVGHVVQLICINFHSYSPSSFQIMTLTFDTRLTSLTHLFKYFNLWMQWFPNNT